MSLAINNAFIIALLGDASVGKTTWINRLATGDFTKQYDATVKFAKHILDFDTNHGKVTFQIYEKPGAEKFNHYPELTRHYDAAIIMYDTTSRATARNVEYWRQWLRMYRQNSNPDCPIIVCANKVDVKDRKVYGNIALNFPAIQIDISAKSHYRFDEPFLQLCKILMKQEALEFVESEPVMPPSIDGMDISEYQTALEQFQSIERSMSFN